LPENSRVCLQCGTVAGTHPSDEAGQKELDFLKPALIGGLFLGVLSSIPYIGALCCLWVLGGGAIAAYLLNQQRPGLITLSDGAFGGVISGLVGAVAATLLSIPVRILTAESIEAARRQMEEGMGQMRDAPPALRNFMEFMMQMVSPEITVTQLLITFVINAVFYSLFAMVGGILAAAIFNRKRPAE
jgi:hypothetical protein